MAKINDQGVSGLLGPVVYYIMNGQRYVRLKPKKRPRRQRKGRPEMQLFGTISKYGSAMVKELSGHFAFAFKLSAYNDMRGWMRNEYAAHPADVEWPLAVKRNSLCNLNRAADLRDFLPADIGVADQGAGKLLVTIPALNPAKELRAPVRCHRVNLKLMVATSPFKDSAVEDSGFCLEQYSFDYTDQSLPAKELLLDTKALTGHIAILAAGLEFETADSTVVEEKWLPAAAIAVGRVL